MADESHVEVRGVSQVFSSGQQRLAALDRVDLSIERGSFVSIVGPSGGGKTTLLRAIGGLLSPTAGSVLIDGRPPASAQRRKSIGFVFQSPALLPWRTVISNIQLPLQVNRAASDDRAEDPERLLNTVALERFRNYYPHQLSGGMRQRVALARALVSDPTVLLMDEPLGALDEMTRSAMRYELVRLWESSRKTVVFVTHSVPEAVLLSDRVVVLSSRPGRILADLEVGLPRPRSEELELSAEFIEHTRQIRERLSLESSDAPIGVEAGRDR
jgi:NitT/TauT family transport system ATP-binding protein